MASETLARAETRGRLVAQEAREAQGRGLAGRGVHGADITGAPTPHNEKEPQHSNDPRWEH